MTITNRQLLVDVIHGVLPAVTHLVAIELWSQVCEGSAKGLQLDRG